MSKKRNFIDFNDPAICSVYVLQKDNNKDLFLEEAINFLNKNQFKNDQFTRFIQLLRISDVLLDDEGIINQRNIDQLKYILQQCNLKNNQEKEIQNILNDICILSSIKSNNIKDKFSKQDLYNYIGYFNYKLLKLISDYKKYININANLNLRDDSKFIYELEICILQISRIVQILMKNYPLNISKLNISKNDEIINNNIIKKLNFEEAISLWKYANAQIKQISGKYVINGWTEYSVAFVISRKDSQDNRLLQYNRCILSNNMKVKIYSILKGIVELWNIDIPKLNNINDESEINTKINSKKVEDLLEQKVDTVELYKWIFLLETMRQMYIQNFNENIEYIKNLQFNHFFQEIDISKIHDLTTFSKEEIKKIFSNLLMSDEHNNDFFDTPIIYCNDKYYTYVLAWLVLDPIYIINNVMKRFRNELGTFHEIGRNLETELSDKLQNYEYNSSFSVKKNERYKNREVDLIVKDDYNHESVLIECKTFNIPSSIKDYAIQLDKIISHHHIENLKKNFNTLRDKPTIKSFLKETNIHELYLANIIIPKSYIHIFNTDRILYLPYFTFYKLLSTPKEYLDLEFNNLIGWHSVTKEPISFASFGENEAIELDCNNILSNLDILSRKQPKTKIYLNERLFHKNVYNNLIKYESEFLTANELDCGFIKLRYLE